MIKTYCDKCGEEIQHLQEIVNINMDFQVYIDRNNKIQNHMGVPSYSDNYQHKVLHKDCYEKILKLIK
jgi:hypothetical protein